VRRVSRVRRGVATLGAAALVSVGLLGVAASPAGAVTVSTEAQLRAAFGNAVETLIDLANDITLANCSGAGGDVDRSSATGLTLDGHGFTVTQKCPGERVLHQDGAGALTLANVTITGGDLSVPVGNAEGGGVHTQGPITLVDSIVTGNTGSGEVVRGAGIFAVGDVELRGSTVSDSSALATTDPGDEGRGGGIFVQDADVTLTDSFLVDNRASGFFGVGAGLWTIDGTVTLTRSIASGNVAVGTSEARAGGVQSQDGDVVVVDSTVSGNRAEGTGSGIGTGGGVVGALVTVVNSTITDNGSVGQFTGSGGIDAGQLVLVYATVEGNAAEDAANIRVSDGDPSQIQSFASVVALPIGGTNCVISGDPTISFGFNHSDDASCGFTAGTDTEDGADPLLGALGDHGGPTPTRVPQEGSPLIDAIPVASCQDDGAADITTDQRGFPRPAFAGCDIGAVEVQPDDPDVPVVPIVVTPTFTG
jgi:hypothetical protein